MVRGMKNYINGNGPKIVSNSDFNKSLTDLNHFQLFTTSWTAGEELEMIKIGNLCCLFVISPEMADNK